MFSMKITGGQELARTLRALPMAVQRETVLDALTDAAEPMRVRMGQLARRSDKPPHLADNIGVSVIGRIGDVGGGRWQARHEEEHAVAVGPTKDFFYGIFLEYHLGFPFMRPAFDGTVQTSFSILQQRLWKSISHSHGVSPTGRHL